MIYDYQYNVAAIMITVVLLIISWERRGFRYCTTNRIFYSLIYINILTSIIDLFTYVTIAEPDLFDLWFCYFVNIVYLMMYELTAMTFLKYVAALIGEGYIKRIANILFATALLLLAVLMCTTPFTHWIVYFDENAVYQHGSLSWLMYLIPMIFVLVTVIIVFLQKHKLNHFQRITMITLYLVVIVCAIYQYFNTKVDIGTLMYSIVLLVIYMVFENPAYYTYRHTRCLNRRAFFERISDVAAKSKKAKITLVGVFNKPHDQGIHSEDEHILILMSAAEHLAKYYGQNVFCIDNGRFVIIQNNTIPKTDKAAEERLARIMARPVNVGTEKVSLEWKSKTFDLESLHVADDFIDHLIESINYDTDEELFGSTDLSVLLLRQHQYRETEEAVLEAISDDRFQVYYQPIYDVNKNKFHSAEALIRLTDPRLGALNPEIFIPIAEKNGSILKIGEMVFEKVCSFIEQNLLSDPDIQFIEVNLSSVQISSPGLSDKYIGIMKKHHIPADRINFEVTESSHIIEDPTAAANFRTLREYGIEFSVDDYGSGFASAEYLYKLPVSIIKIDKSILWSAMKNESAMTVLCSSMRMIHDLKKKIVVEGVENVDMLHIVSENAGDYIQGFYYSRPLPPEDFINFIRSH